MIKVLIAALQCWSLLLVTRMNAQTSGINIVSINIAKIDQYLDSASKEFRFNGVVHIAQSGQVLLNKGYGWKNVKGKLHLDSSGIFQIGSLTKQFTAAIIMKLQEEGKLSVSDLLIKFFPAYPNGDKISLYHLLTHTSGIVEYTKSFAPYKLLIKKTVSKKRVLNIFEDKPLAFEPGTRFSYSSSNYYLLGLIIEHVTGKPYEKVVREQIFEPLQMAHSGFDFRNLPRSSKTTGYSVFYKGRYTEAADVDSTVLYSAGGIYSTSGDLYKWLKAVSDNQILNSHSWKRVFTPNQGNYGLGWAIDSLYGRRYITHSGSITNFTSLVLYFPHNDISIILLSNTAGNLWNNGIDISQMIFNQPHPWGEQHEVRRDSAFINQYSGSYSYDKDYTLYVSVKDGKLLLNGTRNTGIRNASLIALSDSQFYNTGLHLKIEFVKDYDGKVTGLKSIRDGWSLEWQK